MYELALTISLPSGKVEKKIVFLTRNARWNLCRRQNVIPCFIVALQNNNPTHTSSALQPAINYLGVGMCC